MTGQQQENVFSSTCCILEDIMNYDDHVDLTIANCFLIALIHISATSSWNFGPKVGMTAIACEFLLGSSLKDLRDAIVQKVDQLMDSKCLLNIAICKKLWCTGHRMCHNHCMLREWANLTQDPCLKTHAERCAGRCVAWDLLPSDQPAGDAKLWEGHWFTNNEEVDRTRLGYHHSACPLRGDRNVLAPHEIFTCRSEVFGTKKKSWLRRCCLRLQQIDFQKVDMKLALEIEMIKEVLGDENWIPELCGAEHLVDPWLIHPISVDCVRQKRASHVCRNIKDLLAELELLHSAMMLSSVLGELFSGKRPSLRKLNPVPVPDVVIPMSSEQEEAEIQMDDVVESFGCNYYIDGNGMLQCCTNQFYLPNWSKLIVAQHKQSSTINIPFYSSF